MLKLLLSIPFLFSYVAQFRDIENSEFFEEAKIGPLENFLDTGE